MKDMQHNELPDGAVVQALPEDAIWIAQWREMGSRTALDRLLRFHSGRVKAMARVWSRGMAHQDDLVSEGMLALIACLDGYVPRANVPFFAYARPFVRAAMRRAFYSDSSVVAVPLHHVRILREGKGTALDQALFRAATSPDRLDAPDAPELSADCDTGEAALIRAEAEHLRGSALDDALNALSETDRLLMERRRQGGAGNLSDLAKRFGVSPAQALQIEVRALARLRTQLILRGVTSAHVGCGP